METEGRPASLSRLAMMSHCGARILDLEPADERERKQQMK